MFGERLNVLFVRRRGASRLYVCEGGPLGTIGIAEEATDRGAEAAEWPLGFEVLAELAALVAVLGGERWVQR